MTERITFANCIKVLTCRGCGHRWGVGVLVIRAGLSTPCRACGLRTLARGEVDTFKGSRKPRKVRVDPGASEAVQPARSYWQELCQRMRFKVDASPIPWEAAERDRGQPGGRLGASEDLLLELREMLREVRS